MNNILQWGRLSRREAIGSTLALGAATVTALSCPAGVAAQTLVDIDVLNFALNLSYLQGQFLSYIVTGAGVSAQTGTGAIGTVNAGRKVALDAPTTSMLTEIGSDTRAAANPMRVIIGALAIGQPQLDISGGANGPFTAVMQLAGVVPTGSEFDPYGSEENMLYSVFYLKATALSTYCGLLPLLTNRVVIQLFSGLIETEAHHVAVVRGLLYARGASKPQMRANADKIVAFRRAWSGTIEQGVSPATRTYMGPAGPATVLASNVTPTSRNGQVGGCTPAQALNLLYVSRTPVAQGGFFPLGVNGNLRTSAGV